LDGGALMLVPVDGEPEPLTLPINAWRKFSPRGRLLALHDWQLGTVFLRDLAAGSVQELAAQDVEFDFVLSKQHPGARLWLCEAGQLDLVVAGERTELAQDVICASVVSSPMHSLLAFATIDGVIAWADADTQLVTTTSLAGFEYDPSNVEGVRRDYLEMTPSGAYLRYTAATRANLDSEVEVQVFDALLFDLDSDQVVFDSGGWPAIGQAPLFEAPLFVTDAGESFAIQAGGASSLATGVQQLRAGMDSAVALMADGSVQRFHGAGFAEVVVELPANAENGFIFTSRASALGYAIGGTMECATPDCINHLFALRGFGPGVSTQRVLSRNLWPQIHVGEDGTLVTDAIIVEGTLDDWSSFPFPRLRVIAPDGSVVADWEHSPNGDFDAYGRFGEDRIAAAYSDYSRADALLLVDPVAGTIDEVETYPDGDGEIQAMWADPSGQVVVLEIDDRVRIVVP
jgi:hypothetical protein